MKISMIALAAGLIAFGSVALAETGAPSGAGLHHWRPGGQFSERQRNTTGMSPIRSGSGTSTLGGSDANDDQGRDKMPDSSVGVRPYDKQNKPPK
jgi:hypothetical protein